MLPAHFLPGVRGVPPCRSLAFVLNDNGSKAADRLDTLTGRKRRRRTTNILKKTAYDRDKKSLLEA